MSKQRKSTHPEQLLLIQMEKEFMYLPPEMLWKFLPPQSAIPLAVVQANLYSERLEKLLQQVEELEDLIFINRKEVVEDICNQYTKEAVIDAGERLMKAFERLSEVEGLL